jgi:hypothetical protein
MTSFRVKPFLLVCPLQHPSFRGHRLTSLQIREFITTRHRCRTTSFPLRCRTLRIDDSTHEASSRHDHELAHAPHHRPAPPRHRPAPPPCAVTNAPPPPPPLPLTPSLATLAFAPHLPPRCSVPLTPPGPPGRRRAPVYSSSWALTHRRLILPRGLYFSDALFSPDRQR